MNKIKQNTSLLMCLLLAGTIFAQDLKKPTVKLPTSVVGEWYNDTGNREYNGLLIHSDFIEWNYRAFIYQKIVKTNNNSYSFSAKDLLGDVINGELTIISKDTIQLRRGNSPLTTYVSRNEPKDSKRITFAEVPKMIKKQWFTTDGKNNLEFDVTTKKFSFRNKAYNIEEIINFKSSSNNEYRFIVKNNKEYRMFYFKNYTGDYLQVGFNGKMGDLYKANKGYPDVRIHNASEYLTSIFPKQLRGNWLTTDGNNAWTYGFYYDYAIIDKEIWNYKKVKQKRKLVVITLEKNGVEKTVYAKQNKDNTVGFGTNKKKLFKYSLHKTANKNLKRLNDNPYKESDLFKIDSTTYAGIIKNYSKQSGQKTGMVYVNNIFTSNQDSYLVKIKDDGSFLVKFPLYYPQEVFVRLPNYSASVFVEQGKETWQLINSNKEGDSFFAGDCAQLNTELNSFQFILKENRKYYNLSRAIPNISMQEYKEKCFGIHKNQVALFDSVVQSRYTSKKARQIMRLTLDYSLYKQVLGYDLYNRDQKERKIDSTYIGFLTPKIFNNKLAVMSGGYDGFIMRLRYNNIIGKEISIIYPEIPEFIEILKNKGVVFANEDQEFINAHINFKKENAVALKKRKDFNSENKKTLEAFFEKYGKVYAKISQQERENLFKVIGEGNMDSITKYSSPLNLVFTSKEIEVFNKSNHLLTKEEQEKISAFYNEEQNKKNQAFYNTYRNEMNEYVQEKYRKKELENINQFFKDKGSWMKDLLIMQGISRPISEQLSPLSDMELNKALKNIDNPYLASYLEYENKKAIAKIEANKNSTDYVVNETPKTEADKVFEAIIAKYKNKVVFVDFWATWCGPCRSGIKKMKPLKEELKEEDIVFVYITDQTSPEKTYNNMVPDIKGEHYRVSQDEWNYLASKFNITGIPHYTLVNKKGKVVKEKVYFASSIDSFKQLFKEYLNE